MKLVSRGYLIRLKSEEASIQAKLKQTKKLYASARDRANLAYGEKMQGRTRESARALHSAQVDRTNHENELRKLHAELDEKQREFDRALIEFFGGKTLKKREWIDRRNGEVVKIDVFYGGLGEEGDGLCHGHAVIEKDGRISYQRNELESHDDPSIDRKKFKKKFKSKELRSETTILYPNIA